MTTKTMETDTYSGVCLWKRDRLQEYLRDRGLPTSGKLDELRALVFGAQYFDVAPKKTANEAKVDRAERYRKLLTINDAGVSVSLPDPLSDLKTDWVGEAKGISEWPPCIYSDISEYLINSGEKDLRTRLMTDYKEGKAYSYFDSKWLQEVFIHPITPESKYCFLKSECIPSMNIHNLPHILWVCLIKKTGQVVSAYCTCFAG